MYTKNIILLLALLHANFVFIKAGEIEKKAIFAPQGLGNISVYHDDDGFKVKNNKKMFHIQPYYMDKDLRGISKANLKKLIAAGSYISVNGMPEHNHYSLQLKNRLKGGGPIGWNVGFWTGKIGTYMVCYGGILVASAATGPAAKATYTSLSLAAGPSIEGASNYVAIGSAIWAGGASGPL